MGRLDIVGGFLLRAEVLIMKRILVTGRELSVDFERASEQMTVYFDDLRPAILISQ